MKTFVTDLAAKSSPQGQFSAFRHWLFVRQEALRYALAPVAVAIAFLARLALAPILGDASPYLLFVPAVLTAAGLGGLGPGLLATGLSVVLGFFVITMSPGVSASEMVDAALFTMIGAGIAWSGEQLQRNRIRAATSTRDALAREAHLASILNTVPDAMIVIDEDGIVQSFSPAAERLFGYSAAEMIGKNVKMFAVALPGESRRLYRAISADRTKANHRNWPRRGRRAQGRLDLPDGAGGGRNALERPALFHWLHPRHNAAPAVGGEAAGAAIRGGSYFPIDGDGPDGVSARP
jgi:PAS domain S-box-containing protein